jgi:Flp pilus assembly protein TadG
MRSRINRRNERGASIAEFSVVALFFFMIIFGIIEFGRLLYIHNALADASRRGARYAALHQLNDACVANAVIYGESNINQTTCAPSGPPLINGLTSANIVVTYQGSFGMNIGTATVKIQNYTFNLSIPLINRTLTMPAYTTTLPAESAGVIPSDL